MPGSPRRVRSDVAGWWLLLQQPLSVCACVLCTSSARGPCPSLGTCLKRLHALPDTLAVPGTVSMQTLLRGRLQVRLAPGAEGQAQAGEKIMGEGSGRGSRGNAPPSREIQPLFTSDHKGPAGLISAANPSWTLWSHSHDPQQSPPAPKTLCACPTGPGDSFQPQAFAAALPRACTQSAGLSKAFPEVSTPQLSSKDTTHLHSKDRPFWALQGREQPGATPTPCP